jgi:hypothetical protein
MLKNAPIIVCPDGPTSNGWPTVDPPVLSYKARSLVET